MRAPSWQTIANMENARWRRFARDHAGESERCAELAEHVGEFAQSQVVELAELARVNGWPLARAGGAPTNRRRRPR